MSPGEIAGIVVGSCIGAMYICVCVWKYRKDQAERYDSSL